MAKRPSHIDIPPTSFDPLSRPLYTPHGNLATSQSDVPPALSPLDAFAMQSRMLAKRFEEENNSGKRISRLPVNAVASEFAKSRPGYFRSMTTGSPDMRAYPEIQEEDSVKIASEVQTVDATQRPVSHYPQMILTDSLFGLGKSFTYQNNLNSVVETTLNDGGDKSRFSFPRSQSPEEIQTILKNGINISPPLPPATISSSNPSPPKFSIGPSLMPQSPSQPFIVPSTIRPVAAERFVDSPSDPIEETLQTLSLEKPNPAFHKDQSVLRSPSLNSERSVSSSLNRPSMNFSRPISRQSRPSMESKVLGDSPYTGQSAQFGGSRMPLDIVYRQDSADTSISPFSNDAPQTPTSLASEDVFSSPDAQSDSTPACYTYAKYALGKQAPKRESVGIEEFISRQFNWDAAHPDTAFTLARPIIASQSPPSPALTNSSSFGKRKDRAADLINGSSNMSPRPSGEASPAQRRKLRKSRPNTPTTITSEASTIKSLPNKAASIKEIPPEEHLSRGIDLHEQGNLQKSTYHLRLAAKAGHPTAMLLYALACRHGWGMKPSPADAVLWLQRAVDFAQLEVAEDEDLLKQGQALDSAERKTHKAQFALSIFELGMSYMKGWGVAKDESLGLRCFEIAGNWGDADALAETGRCYEQGIGCKKDLKKASKFYRLAEEKGIQVVGNSWIYKDKYQEEADDEERAGRMRRKSTSESKKREKSRTRAFFTRKKSNAS